MSEKTHCVEQFRTSQPFSTYTKASIQNESETSFYYASKHYEYQVFSCTGICILFVQ